MEKWAGKSARWSCLICVNFFLDFFFWFSLLVLLLFSLVVLGVSLLVSPNSVGPGSHVPDGGTVDCDGYDYKRARNPENWKCELELGIRNWESDSRYLGLVVPRSLFGF